MLPKRVLHWEWKNNPLKRTTRYIQDTNSSCKERANHD